MAKSLPLTSVNVPHNLGFLLKAASRLYSMNFERRARELGLNLSQCRVLVHLSRSEGLSQARLAQFTETDPMTLVRVLDRMEREIWIERRPDPDDRRAHRVYLKEDAKTVLARICEISDRARNDALAGMGSAACEQLIDLLEQIQKNLSIIDGGETSVVD